MANQNLLPCLLACLLACLLPYLLNGEKIRKADREQQQKYRSKKAKNAINAAMNESTVGSSTSYNVACTFWVQQLRKQRGLYLYHHEKEQQL